MRPAMPRAMTNSAMLTPDSGECFRRDAENRRRDARAPPNSMCRGSIHIVLQAVAGDVGAEGPADGAVAGSPAQRNGDKLHIGRVRLNPRGLDDADGAVVGDALVAGSGSIAGRES